MRIIALAVAVLISASVTAVATSAAGVPPHPRLAGSTASR